MPFSEEHPKLPARASAFFPAYAQKQRRRMLAALALLLVALLVVFIRDWQYWFPEAEPAVSISPAPAPSPATDSSQAPVIEEPKPKIALSRVRARSATPRVVASQEPQPMAVVTNRAVLPPLQVEVVAGDQHHTLRPGSNSIDVELQPPSSPQGATGADSVPAPAPPATDASERVQLSPRTSEVVSNPVHPSYPTLARQMKVQGSVVLQALVGKTGDIQDLRVLSGPSILSNAAQEAVKKWRFKPYYLNGAPVETQCSITVNFTISAQ